MKIFISWSKPVSNSVAKCLKDFFKEIFVDTYQKDVTFFISSENINSGAKWFDVICTELSKSDLAIVCLTKQNKISKWLDFESGAIAFNNKNKVANVCPFLFDITEIEKENPLSQFQITKNNKDDLYKLVKTVNVRGQYKLTDKQLSIAFESNYTKLETDLLALIKDTSYDDDDLFNEFFKQKVYPPNKIEMPINDRLFIGTPMASIDKTSYSQNRLDILSLIKCVKKHWSIKDVYSPVQKIKSHDEFDGKEKAMEMDFTELKKSDYNIFIYPKKTPSSVLVEIGYAIALLKRTIIFVKKRDSLPFMLQQADRRNSCIKIYTYNKFSDIIDLIEKEGRVLLNFNTN